MAQMQEYLKEYIRLMGDEDLKVVQPVKMNRTAEAAVAAPANKAPATNLTASRFQTQPSSTKINSEVAKPVTKPYKPQHSVLNVFDQSFQIDHLIEKEKDQEPVRPADHEEKSSRMYARDKGSVASLNRQFPANSNGRRIII